MALGRTPDPQATGAARAQRAAPWFWFAPPALLAALRWVLDWQAQRQPEPVAWRLAPMPAAGTTALDLLAPWLLGLALLAVAAVGLLRAVRRGKAQQARRAALATWVLAWLAGSAALGLHTLNRQGLQAPVAAQAQVLGSRAISPNLHSTGGTQLVLRIEGWSAAQQLLSDDPQAAHWRPGQHLQLHWARGRYYGQYVTGWRTIMAP